MHSRPQAGTKTAGRAAVADGHHNYLYCVLYQPEISGGAYDALMRELLQPQEQFPDLRTTLLLAEAIRNGAPIIRYLVGEAMISIATTTFTRDFAKLSCRLRPRGAGGARVGAEACSLLADSGGREAVHHRYVPCHV